MPAKPRLHGSASRSALPGPVTRRGRRAGNRLCNSASTRPAAAAVGWPAAAAAAGGGIATLSWIALIEVRQFGVSRALLRIRQAIASCPPVGTPRQWALKSLRQVNLTAFNCSGVGACGNRRWRRAEPRPAAAPRGRPFSAPAWAPASTILLSTLCTGRRAPWRAVAGRPPLPCRRGARWRNGPDSRCRMRRSARRFGRCSTGRSRLRRRCGGNGRPGRRWRSRRRRGAALAAAGGGGGNVALTAALQPGDRLATFFCRQTNAPLVPGDSDEQCDMKSDRQFERKAFCCAELSCAFAGCASTAKETIAAQGRNTRPSRFLNGCMRSPLRLRRRTEIVKSRLRSGMQHTARYKYLPP